MATLNLFPSPIQLGTPQYLNLEFWNFFLEWISSSWEILVLLLRFLPTLSPDAPSITAIETHGL